MKNIRNHAEIELRKAFGPEVFENEKAGEDPKTGWNRLTVNAVLELLDKFSEQGHSGLSSSVCVQLFSKLALYKPLTPLTGEDEEWTQMTDDLWQNSRASHVFKGPDGLAYDIWGRVFVEKSGLHYTTSESRVPVNFPYMPRTDFVYVED
jgi:hypothetical protein